MMATVQDAIAEAQSYLLTGFREEKNQLQTSVPSGATTLSFTYPLGSIAQGTRLAVDTEIFYVMATAAGNPVTATVLPGMDGSTTAAHNANAIVTVNPKFSDWDCFRAFNREIADLSSPGNGLYQIKTIEATYNPAVFGYDLNVSNLIDVWDIRFQVPGPYKTWPRIRRWQLVQNSDTTDFPSGNMIRLDEAAFPGRPIRVWAMCGFTPAVATTDDLQAAVGLPATANDIPALGTAIRLQSGREVKRNFTEVMGEPRRAEEVPPGANLGASRELLRIYQERIQAESIRLDATYPRYQRLPA